MAFLFLIPIALGVSSLAAAGDLDVSASTPDVNVSTRPAGRNFLRLPGLRYDFVLNAECPVALSVQAISLSIADTRVALNADELVAGPRLEVSVAVPAMQIAPIAVNDFCTGGDEDGEQRQNPALRIPSVLSAQAALTCGNEESSEITYTSHSLDVLLRCEQDDEPAAPTIR